MSVQQLAAATPEQLRAAVRNLHPDYSSKQLQDYLSAINKAAAFARN